MLGNNLIYDLGFHYGEDSEFYLAKGFSVVAVEANPRLIEEGERKFAKEINEGRLTLLHKAVSADVGEQEFYIHSSKTEWSSCFIEMAESDGSEAEKILVEATDLKGLINQYGVPKYLKVDVEGCDLLVAKQLSELKNKPMYVSFETSKKDYAGLFAYLYLSNYVGFQLVNQLNNTNRVVPSNSKEGNAIEFDFREFSSGLFGKDLPENSWLTYDEALKTLIKEEYKDGYRIIKPENMTY